ncbi:hypothetical protein LAZ67_9003251 [Cordylochernes scorpioides]|uniref:Reverse transcriptase n=1 Tax=Cordylochernes scorpioides TaxID=51811 RepID=A0ABY6KUB3_9ARAC|nr:hypothetical protein LAZ67_9003251 [Cordylochernes scorpioides]
MRFCTFRPRREVQACSPSATERNCPRSRKHSRCLRARIRILKIWPRSSSSEQFNRNLGRSASGEDMADYLSGRLDQGFDRDGGDVASLWSEARNATRRLRSTLRARWTWDPDRCGALNETLPHVLQHCRVHSAAWKRRHEAVLERLRKALRIKGERPSNSSSLLRPDLVIIDNETMKITMVDVVIPFENRNEALSAAISEKIRKYEGLAEELRKNGFKVDLEAFLVGITRGMRQQE